MPTRINNPEVDSLIDKICRQTGESRTEAIRTALLERRHRLNEQATSPVRTARLLSLLQREIWPTIPKAERGRRLSRREEDRLLGYGPSGT